MHAHTEVLGAGAQSPGDTHVPDRGHGEGLARPGCLGEGPLGPQRERGAVPILAADDSGRGCREQDSSLLPLPGVAPTAPLSPGCQLSPLQARLEAGRPEAACVAAWHTWTRCFESAVLGSLMNSSGAPRFLFRQDMAPWKTSPRAPGRTV